MKFGIKLLNRGASLNSYSLKDQITIHQGETLDLVFQLYDEDQDLRYVPATAATVYVEIARYVDYFGTSSNIRESVDYSVRRSAVEAFTGDSSIWKVPLTATDTANMMSSNIRVTLTEGSVISKTLLKQAIEVIPKEG